MMRIAWLLMVLRWRLFLNYLKGAGSRDPLERASRAGSLVTPALFGLALGSAALVAGLVGVTFGWVAGTRLESSARFMFVLRATLAAATALLIFTSVLGTTRSLTLHPRVLLLPIARRALHRLDVATGAIGDPVLVALATGLLLFATGLLAAWRVGAGLVALAASLLLLATLASVRSVVMLSLGRALRGRRAAELFTLAVVLVLSLASAVPLLSRELFQSGAALSRALPRWLALAPSELYASAIQHALMGRVGMSVAAVGALAVEALLVFGLSGRLHHGILESDAPASAARRSGREVRPLPRLFPLTRVSSAVAVVQLRTALRSVRGRLIVVLPATATASLYAVARQMPDELPAGDVLGSSPAAALAFGLAFSLYALLAFTMNQLAADRAGLTRQFLTPVCTTALLRGKAVGCGLLFAAQAVMCLLFLAIVTRAMPSLSTITVLVGGFISYALLIPVAAIASAVLPVRSDLSKTGTGGNPHGLSMLGGTSAIALLTLFEWRVLSPAAPSTWRDIVVVLSLAAAATTASLLLLPKVGALVIRRRENILLVAQERSAG
jgi:hypothetical protein